MTGGEILVVLAGLYILGFLWDLFDPDAVVIEFNSAGRALLTLTIVGFLIAYVAVSAALSAAAVLAIILALVVATMLQAQAR